MCIPKHNKTLSKIHTTTDLFIGSQLLILPQDLKFYNILLFTLNLSIKFNYFSHGNFSLNITTNNLAKILQ